jgi:hypothetical protein
MKFKVDNTFPLYNKMNFFKDNIDALKTIIQNPHTVITLEELNEWRKSVNNFQQEVENLKFEIVEYILDSEVVE